MRLTALALSALSVSIALTTLSNSASADLPAGTPINRGFALDRFDPSERGSEWFVLDSLDFRGKVRPALGLAFDWGYKPLVIYNVNDDSEKTVVVRDQVFLHVGGSLNLADRFRFALNLPIGMYQDGDDGIANGIGLKAPGSAIGDLRISGDVRLLGSYGDAFNSAIGVSVYAPTGDRDNYTSDGNTRVQPHLMVSGDIAMFTYGGRLGFDYRPLDDSFSNKPLGSELTLGGSAGIRTANKKLVIGPEVWAETIVTDKASFFKKRGTPIEGLLGFHYTAGDLRFGAGLGTGLTRGWGTPQLRTVANLEWMPAVDEDTDHDGILDKEDACPTVAGIRTNDPRTNGCPPPPPPPDRDGDTVLDSEDACPDVAGVRTTDPKTNGCPPDRDGDGIADKDDACIDVPGVRSDDPKKNGCPADQDGDGIVDKEDACPEVPGVRTNDPKTNGCPSDRDKDGIVDVMDACPDQPGPQDPDPKKNGCPAARIEAGQIKILQQVKFKTNSAEILPESDGILTAVADILKAHPEIKHARVEGHTDNKGAAAYNKTLSQKRAASVVTWLTKHGIDKTRLTSQGFGMERPIDSNDTDDGRQNNRRVEFHIEAAPGEAGTAPKAGDAAKGGDKGTGTTAAPKK